MATTLGHVPEHLTHVDETGAARMVDVSAKDVTARRAVAAGRLVTTAAVVALLRDDALPKGDALAAARIAGIMGAKRTPDLIPLCHPIGLTGVTVGLEITGTGVDDRGRGHQDHRPHRRRDGGADRRGHRRAHPDRHGQGRRTTAASLEGVRVLRKEGGKTGEWVRARE